MILFICCIVSILISNVTAPEAANKVKCLLYNETACSTFGNDSNQCSGYAECSSCFVLFSGINDSILPKLRGCWNDTTQSNCSSNTCESQTSHAQRGYHFCCCDKDECNLNITFSQARKSPPPETPPEPSQSWHFFVYISIAVLFVCTFGFFLHLFNRGSNQPQFSGVPTFDEQLQAVVATDPSQSIGPVYLLEEKAKGKFGSVFKGQLGDDDPLHFVAVKVFPSQDYESWRHEREIYLLPQMNHQNILKYLGSESKGQPIESYWLITEYHELGSLYDFLKANVVSYPQFLRIGEGIASGLALLHDELPAKIQHDESPKELASKPPLAHRDFKSKNVILKSDLTPCIGDFGLARIFPPSEPLIEALGQVGTRKYMAPEVLDGAISFTKDSLLRIDMYACGLVLWELMSRCTAQLTEVPPHKLPFDDEVGPNPTLEEMAEVVVVQKARPKLPKFSGEYDEGWREICSTIEELWDQDAEARLSALCVQVRFAKLIERSDK